MVEKEPLRKSNEYCFCVSQGERRIDGNKRKGPYTGLPRI